MEVIFGLLFLMLLFKIKALLMAQPQRCRGFIAAVSKHATLQASKKYTKGSNLSKCKALNGKSI